MRESNSGGGAILYLLLIALAFSLASAYFCNRTEPQDELLPVQDAPVKAETQIHLPTPEEVARQAELEQLKQYNRLEGCEVTYYCAELYPHICGEGHGLTASGAPVQPGVSVAVDPGLIPLGSEVILDYGDGELHHYIAQDVGAWIVGGRIDVAVATHDEALALGRQRATVYWKEG